MIYLQDYQYCHIGLASPETIRSWTQRQLPNGDVIGCVSQPSTIDKQTHRAERDGLFCERIFGPIKSNVCSCVKSKITTDNQTHLTFYKDLTFCKKCGVELTESQVRRHRMGYIDLQCSVTHAWYSKQRPNYIARLLNQSSQDIYSLVYYETCLVIRALEKPTLLFFYYADKQPKKPIFDLPLELFPFDDEWQRVLEKFISFKWFYIFREREIITGGDAIEQLLKNLQLNQTIKNCCYEWKWLMKKRLNKQIGRSFDEIIGKKKIIDKKKIIGKKKIINKDEIIDKSLYTLFHRLALLRNILHTKVAPEWMVLSCLPVLPPALRPMVELKQGEFTSSDLNHLYQIVIYRNNHLASVKETYSPNLVVKMQKRMLQKGVDALLANGIGAVPLTNQDCKVYKSFFDIMKGKKGRFRENLLGKRVDYSGRSVIVVGPSLSINQCGLPREMAIELFQPFLIQKLLAKGLAHNLTEAKDILKIKQPIVWKVLATIIQQHVVILNRAPTLHRLGIQAFQPLLVTERAIHLHPLVCAAFNADFDGDQMAVHLPLALKAQAEARILMLPFLSLLSPAGGEAITLPSQDMLLGLYVLTLNNNSLLLKDGVPMPRWPIFSNYSHVLTAYNQGVLCCHSPIWLRWIPNTCIVNSASYAIPVENQYEPSIKSKRLSIYEQIQISNHINALNLDFKRKRMQQVYIFTTVGRVLFNQQIEQAMQSAVREFKSRHIL
jgi:DNA-directed RNA polymerase subunit beta'